MPKVATGQADDLQDSWQRIAIGDVNPEDPDNPILPPMDSFSEYMGDYIRPIANVTQWLLDNTDYPQAHYDELFERHPDLKTQNNRGQES